MRCGHDDLDPRLRDIVAASSPAARRGAVADVHPQQDLVADLGFDSLALVELAAQLEAEFDLGGADTAPVDVRTVADLQALVRRATEPVR